MGLDTREHAPERLDDLTVAGPELDTVLSELAWLNTRLGSTTALVRACRALAPGPGARIVDVGCGAGDLLAALRDAFPDARLTGVDGNPAVLEHASRRVDATFLQADVMAADYRLPPCDLVVSTHFLYHFDDAGLRAFIDRQAPCAWAIGELRRSRVAHTAFGLVGPAVLSRWTVDDGQRAIRRAFTPSELAAVLGPGWTLDVGWFSMVASRGK